MTHFRHGMHLTSSAEIVLRSKQTNLMLCVSVSVCQALPRRAFPRVVLTESARHHRVRTVGTIRTMAVQLGYEAWVKGDPKTKTLGDCEC